MSRKSSSRTPHDEAVAIIEQLVTKNLGGSLEAKALCNQCSEELTINLVRRLLRGAPERLVHDGAIALEFDPAQFLAVRQLAADAFPASTVQRR